MPSLQTTVDVDVPPAALMAIVTDFASYPRFLPDMEDAVVLRGPEPGDGTPEWTVRYAVRVIKRLEYTLRLWQPTPLELRWSLVEGVFKTNNGGWRLEPLDGGVRTRAHYDIELDVGMFVPGSVMKTLVERGLPATMQAFKTRAEARA
jgi:ribosome-associated toxin RatA of RatAB toxin-antitoxin module